MDNSGMQEYEKGKNYLKDNSAFFGLIGSAPEPLLAIQEFEKAILLFKKHKQYARIHEASIILGDTQAMLHANYHAAQAYEGAAIAAVQIKSQDSLELCRKSAHLFANAGNVEKGASVFEKVAQLQMEAAKNADAQILKDAVQTSILLFKEALDLLKAEDRVIQSLPLIKRSIAFCIQKQELKKALDIYKELELVKGRSLNIELRDLVEAVLICLALGEEDEALKFWNRLSISAQSRGHDISQSDEIETVQSLMSAFASCDQAVFDQALKESKLVPFLELEVVRMVKSIKVLAKSSKLQDEIEDEGYL